MLFALLSFLGALLLFVVQPMLAKWLLPVVGGSPGTWAACMVLYQALLLAGYVYAHLLTRRLAPRAQARVHAAVVLAAALALYLTPLRGTPVLAAVTPALAIPWLLAQTIGLPFFVLATTTPLVQRWATYGGLRSPYLLYALSNAGSLLGLVLYPFAIEPALGLEQQRSLWATAFWLFALGTIALAVSAGRAPASPKDDPEPAATVPLGKRVRWVVAAFVPSVMLLAATNHITVDVAAMPLLWVVPLALYLVSFIVAFSVWSPAWRGPTLALFVVAAVGLGMNAFAQAAAPLWRQLGSSLLALFSSALLCHGELAEERPAAGGLTGYYVLVALGGVLGGVFVSLIAPLIFSDYFELELGTLATFGVLLVAARAGRVEAAWQRGSRRLLFLGTGICVPLLASSLLVRSETTTRQGTVVEKRRGFLGPLKVVDVAGGRMLTHGRIQHGFELADPAQHLAPTLYFGPQTLLGHVLSSYHADRPRRVGVLGLGAGTLASYGRSGDTFRFYELDPHVIDVAQRDFGFLAGSAAKLELVVGDGRLELAREPPHGFDVLVLDAFSSDSVPVHLLTREAFAVYARQLAPDGVLLANVSNRYLSVDRVVRAGARSIGFECALGETPSDPARHAAHAEWALMAPHATLAALTANVTLLAPVGDEVLWTDTRASILPILRWRRR